MKERVANELIVVVCDDVVGDAKPVNDVPDEVSGPLCSDRGHCLLGYRVGFASAKSKKIYHTTKELTVINRSWNM